MTKHMAQQNDLLTTLYHYSKWIESLIYLFEQGVQDRTQATSWDVPDNTQQILEMLTFKRCWGVVFNTYQNQNYITLFKHIF